MNHQASTTLKDKIIPVTSKAHCNNLMMYQCHGNVPSCVYVSKSHQKQMVFFFLSSLSLPPSLSLCFDTSVLPLLT